MTSIIRAMRRCDEAIAKAHLATIKSKPVVKNGICEEDKLALGIAGIIFFFLIGYSRVRFFPYIGRW